MNCCMCFGDDEQALMRELKKQEAALRESIT